MKAYEIREMFAYSKVGKIIATLLRNIFFKNSRVHWVQSAIVDMSFAKLS